MPPRKKKAKKTQRRKQGLDMNAFPPVQSATPRRLYFDDLTEKDRSSLLARGYNPVVLRSLPRNSELANKEYLSALLCGLEDGTIYRPKEVMAAIKLDMTHRGMLEKHDTRTDVQIRIGATVDEVKELWDWKESRHSLQGNTTMVQPEQIVSTLQRAEKEGKKK